MKEDKFDYLYDKYFAKMSKKEMFDLIISLIVTNKTYDIEEFLDKIYKTTKEERERMGCRRVTR